MIDFPSSPSAGQVFTDSGTGLSWTYTFGRWRATPPNYATGAVLGNPAASAAAPAPTSTARMIRASLGDGTAGQAIISGGTGADPAWGTVSSGGGSGITQLTGDVLAGPGSGSQAATLSNTTVAAGNYTNSAITVDAKGRITAASSGSAVSAVHPALPLVAGRWYTTPYIQGSTTGSAAANTIHATPFFVPSAVTLSQIAIGVTTAVVGNAELGVYADAGGLPGALLLDAGMVSTNATGTRAITGLSTSLSPGWVWLVMAVNGPTSVVSTPSASGLTIMNLGLPGVANGQFQYTGYTGAWTFAAGALPSTFPSPTVTTLVRPLVGIQI